MFIYILKLTDNKYYVGKTTNPQFTLSSHFSSEGSIWTKKYKPIECIEIFKRDNFDEDKYTIKYMEKYGIQNVRGGSFCEMKLSSDNKTTILKMINGATDKCYECGEKGHFTKECHYVITSSEEEVSDDEESEEEVSDKEIWECEYCDKDFENEERCLIHENKYCKENPFLCVKLNTTAPVTCFRCGRDGHYNNKCNASRHINGYKLH
jgi:predicted GIY-YIG superfamily endonuclease